MAVLEFIIDLVKDWKYFKVYFIKMPVRRHAKSHLNSSIHRYFQNTTVEITKNHFCQNILGHFGHNVFDAACLEVASFVLLD